MPWDDCDAEVTVYIDALGRIESILPHVRDELHIFGRTAINRALDLLISHLTPSQLEDFARTGCFDVIGARSGTRYTISTCRRINNVCIDGECSFCAVVPAPHVPIFDQALTQKMLIEHDEIEYLAIAHRSAGPPPKSLLPFQDEVSLRRLAIVKETHKRALQRRSWITRLFDWWDYGVRAQGRGD